MTFFIIFTYKNIPVGEKKYGILQHFDQFELKSSCTVDIRPIRGSVENTITMDTRENFDEKARTNIPDGDLHSGEKRYSIVRNRWDYSPARRERQISLSCFHHRYFPPFFPTYISPILPSINVHFSGTRIIKSREKVPTPMSVTIEFRCFRFDIELIER